MLFTADGVNTILRDLCVHLYVYLALRCSLFIHPATQKQYADAYDSAIADLRYGSITVNCPCLVGFSATPLAWGAFPGHTPQVRQVQPLQAPSLSMPSHAARVLHGCICNFGRYLLCKCTQHTKVV